MRQENLAVLFYSQSNSKVKQAASRRQYKQYSKASQRISILKLIDYNCRRLTALPAFAVKQR